MKKIFPYTIYLILMLFVFTTLTCKKDELVKVTKLETGSVTDITYTTATASATFTDLSGNVTEFGHCWNASGNPTTSDPRSIVGGAAKKGDFSSNLTGLSAGTRYYVKAYAIDGGKPVYGNQEEFTTNAYELPVLTTKAVTSITYTSALSGGDITSDGGRDVTARGVCWSTSQNPTISDRKTNNGTGTGTFISYLTGLTASTTYYARAYATNSEGTAYGNQQNFTTDAYSLPTVSTESVSDVTHNSAVSGGNVTSDGGSTVTARGVCWGTSENPTLETNLGLTTDGNGTGTFVSALTGLTPDNDYHVRAYAKNVAGTSYGADVLFSTTVAPIITITSPTNGDHWLGLGQSTITWSSNIGGNVSITLYKGDNYLADIIASTENDGSYSWNSVIDGQYDNDFKVRITSLEVTGYFAESNYFKISESTGTTGLAYGYVKTYNTIKIGYQWWMAENLSESYYPDLTSIPHFPEYTDSEWANLGDNNTDDAYCYYDYVGANQDTYGKLYTYAAAIADNWEYDKKEGQGVCPDGWHLPTDEEWKELEMYLGMSQVEADGTGYRGTNEASKLAGNASLWTDGNLKSNAEFGTSGFSGLPGGSRHSWSGTFNGEGSGCVFWSATEDGSDYAYIRMLNYTNANVYRESSEKSYGYSVRCVRDN